MCLKWSCSIYTSLLHLWPFGAAILEYTLLSFPQPRFPEEFMCGLDEMAAVG